MNISNDTIFAPATAPGRSGIAVLRISGRGALQALESLGVHIPLLPRVATLLTLRVGGEVLDRGLGVYFSAPSSFTGEDVVELHVHGSRAVMEILCKALAAMPGMRFADPGEFSRRAFLNGKMDLTQVEGVADLIEAETEAQRRQALRHMEGHAGRIFETMRAHIVRTLARFEAVIDFPEEDIPETLLGEIDREVDMLRNTMESWLGDAERGRHIREGINIVILGAPNAGKSSLMNALARRDIAIVSPIAGTTRDALEVHLNIDGYAVTLIDTAGLRESDDPIEQEGVRRARLKADKADLRLLLFDGEQWPQLDSATLELCQPESIVCVSKADRGHLIPMNDTIPISVTTPQGLDELMNVLACRLKKWMGGPEPAIITRERHKQIVIQSIVHLQRFALPASVEVKCEELRLAAYCIGKITGKIAVDELLDHVFREFCIGK